MSDSATSGLGNGATRHRILAIDTPLGTDAFVVTALRGEDALSRCFLFEVTVVYLLANDHDVESLLGEPITLWIMSNGPDSRRPINGYVRRIVSDGFDRHKNRIFRLEVVPGLWFLSLTEDCRIFQNQSVPDILETVLSEHGIRDVAFRTIADLYPSVEYCVQFQETALNFVSRLMEHLGLFYWHEHSAHKHILVIADRNEVADLCDPPNVTLTSLAVPGGLKSMEFESVFRPGKWTLNDYDFESPTKKLLSEEPTPLNVARMKQYEIYRYPGYYRAPETGRRLTRIRIEQEEAKQRHVFGTSHCGGFSPGYQFSVTGGPGDPKAHYLLTEVRHSATSYGVEAHESAEIGYSNEYKAILATVPFRPERATHKPLMRGAETATVVGPAGEAIHCDQYGRVRVLFHWDRRGRRDDSSSCWVRVAQARSGSYYGNMVIPHVGHEVIVSFLEGDPDRPLITGTVPNALTMPPMTLPADKHKTIQRDHGDNKIVMHGKAGEETLRMISPRRVSTLVSGYSARPAGAMAPVTPPTRTSQSSLIFYSNPVSYNLSGEQGDGGAMSQDSSISGGSSATIDVFKDAEGLTELYNEWYGVAQSDIDNSSAIAASSGDQTQGSYGTQDGTAADSYLNWGSEGKINCLVLDNNNLWVNKNNNTWINGSVFTQINGNSDTQIGTLLNNNTIATRIYGLNQLWVGGSNSTEITGGNLTVVGGANVSVNLGESATTNVITAQTFNIGPAYTLNLGPSATTNVGPSTTYEPLKIKVQDNTISTIQNAIETLETKFSLAQNVFRIHANDIRTNENRLINAMNMLVL
jgi:type VI secretion system secreted protein VgrG